MLPNSTTIAELSFLILRNSSFQFFSLFGTLFIAGIVLTWISRWTQSVFQQFRFPNFGLYVFGIVGVPVHELCHALFAKLFGHDVRKIKWFDPKAKGNSYGSVTHYYNDKSFYHRLGLFFIGMGPVLLAPLILFAIYHFLVPGAGSLRSSFAKPAHAFEVFGASLAYARNFSSLGFYVFLYLTVCITSQMELSPDDFKIARGGIFPFFALFLIANMIAAAFQFNLHGRFQTFFQTSFTTWISFSVLAIFVALLNFALCLLLMNLFNKIIGAPAINPFRRDT